MTTKIDELKALLADRERTSGFVGATLLPYELRDLIAAVEALRKVVKASDQFVADTGMKHGDDLTDAVDEARAALAPFGE